MDIPDKQINILQLRRNNGDRGTPKWVAVDGIVYDVSDCPKWRAEMHERLHFAGQDLTAEIVDAPHPASVLSNPCVKVVGKLTEDR